MHHILSQSQVKPHTFAYSQLGVPKNPATMLDSFCSRCITRSTLALSTLLGHNGSIAILNKAYTVKLESVEKVDIKDNVFIGHGAIVMPGGQ